MVTHRGVLALVVWALASCMAGTSQAGGQAPAPGVHEITMTARNFEFDPSVITVKKGEKVRLLITSADHDHGIEFKGYDINQVLKKGDITTIEFTADRAGTFSFKCSVPCGRGHGRMKGKLVVEE